MKHILILIAGILIGFGLFFVISPAQEAETPALTEATEPTAPVTEPNLILEAEPWDENGVLTELMLNVPNAWKYSYCVAYGERLLFYGYDNHLGTKETLNMAVVDPITGEVYGVNSYVLKGYTTPQVLGESIYICDSAGGSVYELNGTLSVEAQWTVFGTDWNWFVGADRQLYMGEYEVLRRHDLQSRTNSTMLEDCIFDIYAFDHGQVSITYKLSPDGEYVHGILDLNRNELWAPPVDLPMTSCRKTGDVWLGRLENNENIYYLGNSQAQYRIRTENETISLLQEGRLLGTVAEPQALNLYGTDGQCLSTCRLSEYGGYYLMADPIWLAQNGGYILPVKSYEGAIHILFWDLSKPAGGENLVLAPVLEPSAAAKAVKERAEQLYSEYGLRIFLGEECRTEFYEFRGSASENYEELALELETLEQVLRQYPDGFFRQLRAEFEKGIEIHLMENLEFLVGERVDGTYSGIVSDDYQRVYVLIDILTADETTYYHEFSHVIDRYLERDALQRVDALFSEYGWSGKNPANFAYFYSYANHYDRDYDRRYFIDGYATTSPTEDRARVMEYAMMPYTGAYFDGEGLYNKLDYYAACIRDAFDTTGWPETTLWEQYLN